jgi:hypothetical protein
MDRPVAIADGLSILRYIRATATRVARRKIRFATPYGVPRS